MNQTNHSAEEPSVFSGHLAIQKAVDFFRKSQDEINDDTSEADLQSHVVEKMMVILGFQANAISWQKTGKSGIPDFCSFQNREDYEAARNKKPGNPALCIGEIKRPAVDIDIRRSRNSPERQLERYLQTSHLVSESGETIGILTNGYKWKIYNLVKNRMNLLASTETSQHGSGPSVRKDQMNLRAPTETETDIPALKKVFRIIAETLKSGPAVKIDAARNFLRILSDPSIKPDEIAKIILNKKENFLRILECPENSHAKQAYLSDWVDQKAYLFKSKNSTKPGNKLFQENLHFGFVEIEPKLENIQKQDIFNARKAFEEISGKAPLLVLAVMRGTDTTAKIGLSHNGTHSMTAEFLVPDAQSTPRITLGKILEETRKDIFDPEETLEHLSLKPLQQKFYAEIQEWITHCPGWNEPSGKRTAKQAIETRTAILLNLLRVMFCFILKQENRVPDEIFWPGQFPKVKNYHREVLEVFFHDVLNKPKTNRSSRNLDPDVWKLAQQTEFLNGSIFAKHSSNATLKIPEEFYRNEDPDSSGLYNILEEYNWTADEHSHSETDQSMDPDLLGNILERFISMLDNPDGVAKTRQPDGTYYTPKDVVQEMCVRSLNLYTENFAESHPDLDLEVLQGIFRGNSVPHEYVPSSRETLQKFRNQLAKETIADFALGSAIFLVEMMKTLKEVYFQIDKILEDKDPDTGEILNSILENQIYGCDVQPLAVVISRLRIFLMFLAERGKNSWKGPLPNLEARIICAQTLSTAPVTQNEIDASTYRDVIQDLQDLYLKWYHTHDEAQKENLRKQEKRLKSKLTGGIQAHLRSGSLLLNPSPAPCDWDLRQIWPQIFSEENPGFGFILGNPPYLNTINVFKNGKKDFLKMGFKDVNRIEQLFLRLALSLSKQGGIISQIVPSGISIRKDFSKTRTIFQRDCKKITLSHFDNRPSELFPKVPFLKKSKGNRTRPLIITAMKENSKKIEIFTSIFQKWHKEDRLPCIQKQPRCLIPKGLLNIDPLENQWPRILSDPIAKMMVLARKNGRQISNLLQDKNSQKNSTINSQKNRTILEYPKAAYRYLSVTPQGSVNRERHLIFPDVQTARIAFLALNTTILYAWWVAWDDSFHVNPKPIECFPVPDRWLTDPILRKKILGLAKDLENLIPSLVKTISVQGGKSQTLDFTTDPRSQKIVDQADLSYIEAIGTQKAGHPSLIEEMKILQTTSNWNT